MGAQRVAILWGQARRPVFPGWLCTDISGGLATGSLKGPTRRDLDRPRRRRRRRKRVPAAQLRATLATTSNPRRRAPRGAIDLCGRKITVEQRFRGMVALGCLCVVCQVVAAGPSGTGAHIEVEITYGVANFNHQDAIPAGPSSPYHHGIARIVLLPLPDCDSSPPLYGRDKAG